jgi:hypothetical protein
MVTSLPLNLQLLVDGCGETDHPPGTWLREPAREMTILAERYDFSLSLLLLDDAGVPHFADAEAEEDTYDRFVPAARRREW